MEFGFLGVIFWGILGMIFWDIFRYDFLEDFLGMIFWVLGMIFSVVLFGKNLFKVFSLNRNQLFE